MSKHTPATPLPWAADDVGQINADRALPVAGTNDDAGNQQDARYIAHAANAYPKLVEVIQKAHEAMSQHWFTHSDGESYNNNSIIDADSMCQHLLQELGENK